MNTFPLLNTSPRNDTFAIIADRALLGLSVLIVVLGFSAAAFGQQSGSGAFAWSDGGSAGAFAWTGSYPAPNPPPDTGDDAFEENDGPDQVVMISSGTFDLQGLDDDWFFVTLTETADFAVQIVGPAGDLDLYVLDAQGNLLGASEEVGTSAGLGGTLDPGDYIIVVRPYQGRTGPCTMTITGPCAPLPTPDAGTTPDTEPTPDSDSESTGSTDSQVDIDGQFDVDAPVTVNCGMTSPMPMMLLTAALMGSGMLARRRMR